MNIDPVLGSMYAYPVWGYGGARRRRPHVNVGLPLASVF